MDRPRVLVVNEPYAYREALIGALRELRPRLLIHSVEPADLDTLVEAVHPALVVCSQISPAVQAHASAWLLLYPRGEDRAVLGSGLHGRALPSTDFDVVLTALDAVLALADTESPLRADLDISGNDPTKG